MRNLIKDFILFFSLGAITAAIVDVPQAIRDAGNKIADAVNEEKTVYVEWDDLD